MMSLILKSIVFCLNSGAWPTGTYGLVKPKTGCPRSWKEGYRSIDTESSRPNNYWSTPLHLFGRLQLHGGVLKNKR